MRDRAALIGDAAGTGCGYDPIVRLSWFVVAGVAGAALSGCAAHHPELPRAEPIAPPVEPPLADQPKPVPAKPGTIARYGARDLFDPVVRERDPIAIEARWRSTGAEPAIVDVAEIDYLGRCAREFILQQPEGSRRVLIAAFTHYVTACDPDTGKLVLERPLGFDSRERRSRPDVAFLGMLAPRGAGLVLRVSACGTQTSFDRISISSADHRWTSSRLEVRRDPGGCDVAELPFTRALGKVIAQALEGESVIRFEGSSPDTELAFTDQLRSELRSVLDAVDVLTAP